MFSRSIRRGRTFRTAVCLTFVVCTLAPACATDKVTGERRLALRTWTLEEEIALGREAAPLVEAQFDSVLVDPEATRVLGEIVLEMTAHSVRRDDFAFEFHVLDSSIPNALALPGGQIYITRGLLVELESEGQFVSVMGHELGHVEHQHAMFAQSRGVLGGLGRVVGGIGRGLPLVGRVTAVAGGLLGAAPALFVLQYGREQELEADERGLHFAHAMGYDPREGLKTFELLARLERESDTSSGLTLFSTHPANETRIERMQAAIRRDYPETEARPASAFRSDGSGFAAIVAGLRAKRPAYEAYERAHARLAEGGASGDDVAKAEQELREALALVPDEPLFLVGLGEMALLRDGRAEAREHFARAAEIYERFSAQHGHWKPFLYLGFLALASEDWEQALRWLDAGEARCAAVPELQFLLGVAEEGRGNRAGASEHYRRAIELAPEGSELRKEAQSRLRAL